MEQSKLTQWGEGATWHGEVATLDMSMCVSQYTSYSVTTD